MKIIHLLSSNKFSGAENLVCQIISMTRQYAEYEMVYCSPDGQIREALKEREVQFEPIKKMSVSEIKRILQEQAPDVIHAHDMGASFFAALVCGKIPLISHIHNNSFNSRRPTIKAVLYRLVAAKFQHVFWVSKAAQEGYFFREGMRKKSSILYNVIDTEQLQEKAMQAVNQTSYDVVYLGRLTYPKNPQRLVSVLEMAINKKPDIRAAIIGAGDLEEDVHSLICEKNLQKNVDCLGFLENPYGLLQNAKVMLMTSRWEGLPMCALEALTLGLPIISTPTDGMRELLENQKDGYLSEDDMVLAEKLHLIITDAQLQKEMSERALEKSRQVNDIARYRQALFTQYSLNAKECGHLDLSMREK